MSDINKDDDFMDFEEDGLLEESLDDINGLDLDNDDMLLEDDLDEDWDEFDDEDDLSAAPVAPRQRGFISRYFNIILIAVIILAGGFFLYNKFFKGAAAPTQTAASIVPEANSNDIAEPTNNNAASAGGIDLNLDVLRTRDERVVASLPYETDIQAVDTAANTSDVNIREAIDYGAQNIAPEDDFFSEDFIEPAQEPVAEESFLAQGNDDALTPLPDFLQPIAASENAEDTNTDTAEPADAIDSILGLEQSSEPIIDVVAQETTEQTAQLDAELEMLADKNIALEKDLSLAQAEKAGLEKAVRDLESKLAALETKAAKTVKSSATPKVAAVVKTVKPVVKKVAKAATVTQSKPRRVVKAKPVWILSSAQPGRAVLSNQKTGDRLQVEVGQTVAGLGTIRSIDLQNGRWIVQGSQGSVSR